MTAQPLRILQIEDLESDAALIVRLFEKAGYNVHSRRVEDPDGMAAALADSDWDVVIADYNLPAFDAPSALGLLQKAGLDIPFLVVSGAIGEEIAVAMMRAGAHDYLLKDNLARLVPAVERELRECRVRRRRREAESDLARAQAAAHLGSWRWDVESDTGSGSEELYRIFGVDPDTFTRSRSAVANLIHPADRGRHEETMARILRGETVEPFEMRIVRPGGEVRHVWASVIEVHRDRTGGPLAVLGFMLDITERKLAEVALRQAERRYRSLFENTVDAVFLTNTDGRILAANAAAQQMFGMTEEELRSAGREGVIAPDDDRLGPGIEERRATGHSRGELTMVRKDGSRFPGDVSSVIVSTGGEAFVTIRDITDRKRAEEALRESEARERARSAELEAVVDASPVALFVARDPQCSVMIGSRMTYDLLRLQPGSNLSTSAPDQGRPSSFRALKNGVQIPSEELPAQKAASTGTPIRNYEFDVVYEDGTRRTMLGDAAPLFDEEGRPRGAVGAFVDITERKRDEERLRQTQKLESVGLLAGGIAHDFNNLLTGIMGNASLVLEEAPAGSAERIREVLVSAERAAHLTRQLLAYSGKGQFIVRDLDVSAAVQEAADLVQFSIPKSVRLKLDLERRLPKVSMDPGQLQQVLMNLVINAGEAIGEGNPGNVTIATSMVDIREGFQDALGQEIKPGRYAYVDVHDTGGGIDPDKVARIFDPFFTTKFTGRGLGLAAVGGILRAQEGGITVESSPGQGSSFRVYLRVHGGSRADGPHEKTPVEARATVLVVDDESSVRGIIASILASRSYRVLTASDGREAIEVCKAAGGAVDAAIVDIVMPNMTANDLVSELKSMLPGIKILLTSGYSESEALRLCAAYPGANFIQKPYTAQQLAKVVEQLLGTAGTPPARFGERH